VVKLKSSLWKIYGGHHDLGNRYGISVSQMFHLLVITIWSFPRSWLIIGFVTKVTRRVLHMQQALSTLSDQMSSPSDFSGVRGARPLVFSVMFWRSLFVLFPLVTVLSVLLRFTGLDYPFAIFKYFLDPYQAWKVSGRIYVCLRYQFLPGWLPRYTEYCNLTCFSINISMKGNCSV